MKKTTIKLAVLGALSVISGQALAVVNFVSIPTTGFTVGSNTSAYTICNTTGVFGSGSGVNMPQQPTSTTNNACAIAPAPSTPITSPETGYAFVTSATRSVDMNNTYTGGTTITVGSVVDAVFRKPAATNPMTPTPMCIYAAQYTAATTDYNTASGNQYFEMNDIARGGFGTAAVSAAYATISSTSAPVFRIGRTFSAVQHRGTSSGNLTGYVDQPLTTPAFSLSINGVNSWVYPSGPQATPTSAQQSASINTNWIDFTTDINARDDDGSTTAFGPTVYVKAPCTTAAPVAVNDAIRLRQTFQEPSTDTTSVDQPFIEVSIPGFVPPSGSAAPTPVNPF